MLNRLLLLLLLGGPTLCWSGEAQRPPTIDDLQAIRMAANAQISPDGAWVAYQVTAPDPKADLYATHIWVANVATGRLVQLTQGEKSCANPRWSPDGSWLAFSSNRVGEKNQLFVIHPDGGEAQALSKADNGVGAFAWSLDGRRLAFLSSDAKEAESKARKEHLGDFEVVKREYAHQHLRVLEVAEALKSPVPGAELTQGKTFSIGAFSWSPDGSRIAFHATVNPDLAKADTADIYLLDVTKKEVRKLVDQPGPDSNPQWSPDGKSIVFSSAMGNPRFFHANSRLAVVPAEGGKVRSLSDSFDELPGLLSWNADGIYFQALQKTNSHLFRLDPATGQTTCVTRPTAFMGTSFSLAKHSKWLAYTAVSPESLSEVFIWEMGSSAPKRLTNLSEQLKPFQLGKREVISWKSQDGTVIEGVLIRPAETAPGAKHPLLCIIHGGPTGVDRPTAVDTAYYPTDVWVARGAYVLKVNYRGSAGYGEKFRQLNVRNLGVGDAWDVLSGIDHLIQQGLVDPDRVACMGWSQGGYISAFLSTNSYRFKALSVGAGISNWATYYYNTDITPFTLQYLGGSPAADPAIYAFTSPMTAIKKARTPTLIQHGENDRRVPIANAFELRQGLEDQGVKAELVVYKGFGHGITKPRAMRAVMQHNLQWFNHYIFGDPLPDFSRPELPKKEPEKATAAAS